MNAETSKDFWNPPLDETIVHVPHQEMLAFNANAPATLTIAIPTFRRLHLIQETLRSVLAQTDLSGVRIVVVDNDPESDGHAALLAAMPELRDQSFRYLRNLENVGLFGNWNACVAAADTSWVTVLNDDDLLAPGFVATMRGVLAADPGIDALVCSMREFDTRGAAGEMRGSSTGARIKELLRFGLRDRIVLKPKDLFFRNIGGSSLGLVTRPEVLRAVGGWQRAQYPAADYLLNVRLAARYKFVRLKQVLTLVRIEENVSAKLDVMLDCLRQGREVQVALIEHRDVPPWQDRLAGPSLRQVVDEWNMRWKSSLTGRQVGDHVGLAVPERRSLLSRIACVAMRAF